MTKPASIKTVALIGFGLCFIMAWMDNMRDMVLASVGLIAYLLAEIAERLGKEKN